MALLRSLRNRSFAYLWAGQTVSALGDRLYNVAVIWWVLERTGSGEAVAIVAICSMIPTLVFLLVGGVIVDRLSRARVMLISDLARGVLVAGIAILTYTGQLGLGLVYGAAIVFGFVDAFFGPAFSAVVPEIVPPENLSSANSLTTLSYQLSGIGGPLLGAVLVMSGGTALAFAIDALTFFVSAACLLRVRGGPRKPPDARPDAIGELRAGFAAVLSNPWLWLGMLCVGVFGALNNGLVTVSLPFLVKDTLGRDIGSLSFLQAAAGIGAVIAAVVLGRIPSPRRRGLLMYGGVAVCGVAIVVMGLSTTIYAVAAASMLRLAAGVVCSLIWAGSKQTVVPVGMLGRVSSIEEMVNMVMIPCGYYAVGWATDYMQPPTAFLIGGAGLIALSLLAFHPRIRSFD